MHETTIKADRNAGECARAGRVVAQDFYSTAVAHTKLSLWDIPAKYGMIINLLKTCVWRLWRVCGGDRLLIFSNFPILLRPSKEMPSVAAVLCLRF